MGQHGKSKGKERTMEAANSLGAPKNAINSPEQVNELMSKLKYLSNSYVNSIKLTILNPIFSLLNIIIINISIINIYIP